MSALSHLRPPKATRKARLTRAGRKKLMVKLDQDLIQAVQDRAHALHVPIQDVVEDALASFLVSPASTAPVVTIEYAGQCLTMPTTHHIVWAGV